MFDLVTDGGTVFDDNSAGAMAANKAAIESAYASGDPYIWANGKNLFLPLNALLSPPPGVTIHGLSMHEGGTHIQGQGNIFKRNHSAPSERLEPFRNLAISNIAGGTMGKCLWLNLTTALGGLTLQNVRFGLAQQHIYAGGHFVVGPVFDHCKFEGSTSWSRFFGSVTAYSETNCHSAANKTHIRFGSDDYAGYCSGIWLKNSRYEGSTHVGIEAHTQGVDIYNIDIHSCWFEGNANQNGDSDISLMAYGSSTRFIDALNIVGGNFAPPSAAQATAQTTRIGMYEANGAVINRIRSSALVEGGLKFAPNNAKVFNDQMRLRGNTAQANWKTATYA